MKIKFSSIINLFFMSAVIGVGISYSMLYLFHIVLIALFFSYFSLGNFKVKKLPSRLHFIFYFMFLWYLSSIYWSINIAYSFRYLFYIFLGGAIVLISVYYMNTLDKQNRIFKVLTIVFSVELFFSLLEAYTPFRLPISPYSDYVSFFGRSLKYESNLDLTVINLILESPTGFQWNPNNLAVTMLIIFPYFLLYPNNKKIRLLGIISIFLVIVMAGSRGVFISLLFMILLYFLILNKKLLLVSVFVLIPMVILIVVPNIDNFKNNNNLKIREIAYSFDALNTYLFEDISSQEVSIGERQQLIKNGMEALKESYYIGVGGGGSLAVQEKKGGVAGHLGSMHNFWVEMLVDSGIVFTLSFFIWYAYTIFKLYSILIITRHLRFKYYASSTLLAMIAFLPGAISAASVIYFFPMWLMFGFAIATINNYYRYEHENTFIIRS